jgi:hypothetical protein
VSEPPVLENPGVYVGMLKGRDDVALVIEPGKDHEIRICLAPLVALAVADELAKYAKKQLDRQTEAFARHQRNTADQRRPKLDA